MIGIYKITDKISGKSYIGQSIHIFTRWSEHARHIREGRGINGIPLELKNLTFEILELCSTEELDDREIYWIKYYDSYNNGFNKTSGGQRKRGEEKASKNHPYQKALNVFIPPIPEEYMNKLLDLKTCRELADELRIPVIDVNNLGKFMTWNALKDYLKDYGYNYEVKKKKTKGKLHKYYIITGSWKEKFS